MGTVLGRWVFSDAPSALLGTVRLLAIVPYSGRLGRAHPLHPAAQCGRALNRGVAFGREDPGGGGDGGPARANRGAQLD